MTARDAQWDVYMGEGYGGQIYKGEVKPPAPDSSYTIGVRYDGGVDLWSYCDNAIIDNECCYGGTFCGWNGARVSFGPPGEPTFWEIIQNLEAIWEGLDGQRGKGDRVAGHAYLDANPLTLSMCGNGETTLAPAVAAYAPPENSDVEGDGVPGWTVFDTKMDISVDASGVVHGDGTLNVEDEQWSRGERDTLKYTLRSVIGGTGCLRINANATSEGGLSLDGNQNPSGTDGVGPSKDDYLICYTCTDTDPNYAARFASSWAYRQDDMVVVGWHADAEIGTAKYVVEGGDGDGRQALGEVSCGEVAEEDVPGGSSIYLMLDPPYPNPLRDHTLLRFASRHRGPVSLDVYDARGRHVSHVGDLAGGDGIIHTTSWDARDLPSGVYFVALWSGGELKSRRIVIAR